MRVVLPFKTVWHSGGHPRLVLADGWEEKFIYGIIFTLSYHPSTLLMVGTNREPPKFAARPIYTTSRGQRSYGRMRWFPVDAWRRARVIHYPTETEQLADAFVSEEMIRR